MLHYFDYRFEILLNLLFLNLPFGKGIMSELFNVETALRTGALSGTIIFILLMLAEKMKICSINYLALMGSIFTEKKDNGIEMIGFITHLVICILFAFIYAVVFSFSNSSGWYQGALLASGHLILSGIIIFLFAFRRPSLREKLWPSSEYHHPAYNVIIFVVLHLMFGVTNGILYHI